MQTCSPAHGCICCGPYLILHNLLVSDKGEHLEREMLVVQRKCNSGIAHDREEGGGIAVTFVRAARREFHSRTSFLGKCFVRTW